MIRRRSVVITGIGIIAPIGVGSRDFWNGAMTGASVVAPIPDAWRSYFTPVSSVWAPLPKIDFSAFALSRIEQMQFDKVALLGLAAAREAVTDAGLGFELNDAKKNSFRIKGIDPEKTGVFSGTGIGGIASLMAAQAFHFGSRAAKTLEAVRSGIREMAEALDVCAAPGTANACPPLPLRFNPMTIAMAMPNSCSSSIGIKYGLTGHNLCCSTACAAGTSAIGLGYRAIASGECDSAIAGGAEFLGDDYGGSFRAFDATGTLVRRCDDPAAANRPFDAARSGFLFAEGGSAMLLLEEKEAALRRGANPYAEITAFASSFDAFSCMAMEPQGFAGERMLRSALAEAAIEPEAIDYVNAHGTGTVQNDDVESALIERVFGSAPLINSTKSLIGHTIGASGAIEAAVTALSILHQTTHVSRNITNPLRALNFVREVKPRAIRRAVTQSFGFGGHNACLIMERCA
jgi:3-oxoacyl-[acyl-carrier-protein] synthase II